MGLLEGRAAARAPPGPRVPSLRGPVRRDLRRRAARDSRRHLDDAPLRQRRLRMARNPVRRPPRGASFRPWHRAAGDGPAGPDSAILRRRPEQRQGRPLRGAHDGGFVPPGRHRSPAALSRLALTGLVRHGRGDGARRPRGRRAARRLPRSRARGRRRPRAGHVARVPLERRLALGRGDRGRAPAGDALLAVGLSETAGRSADRAVPILDLLLERLRPVRRTHDPRQGTPLGVRSHVAGDHDAAGAAPRRRALVGPIEAAR